MHAAPFFHTDRDPTRFWQKKVLAAAGLGRENEKAVLLLTSGVVERRLSIINIQHGPAPADSIGMPVAAWLLGETLLHWALRWRSQEVRPPTKSTVKMLLKYWQSASQSMALFAIHAPG